SLGTAARADFTAEASQVGAAASRSARLWRTTQTPSFNPLCRRIRFGRLPVARWSPPGHVPIAASAERKRQRAICVSADRTPPVVHVWFCHLASADHRTTVSGGEPHGLAVDGRASTHTCRI